MGGWRFSVLVVVALIGWTAASAGAQECLSPLGSVEGNTAFDLAATGNLVYVAAGLRGLLVVDASVPSEPAVVGSYDPPDSGYAKGVAVEGTVVYLAAGFAGLRIVDASDPSVPVELGSVSVDYCSDVAVRDGMAYLANASDGLLVVDVSDPREPETVGAYLYNYAGRVSLGSHYAFVAGGAGTCGSRLLDVSDPARPVAVDTPALPEFNEVAVVGRHAYLAKGCHYGEPKQTAGGFSVVDLEASGGPALVGSLELPGYATAVAVGGDLAFVAGVDRVFAVDVGDPTLPVAALTHRPDSGSGELAIAGTVAAVGGMGGVELLDLAGCTGAFVSTYLMGAAHLEGQSGTRWRTDLEICNFDPVEHGAEIAFLERGQENVDPATVTVALPAGECTRYGDVVTSVFGLTETAGTVRLTGTARLPCSARTYTLTGAGSYGSFKLGSPSDEAIRTGESGALIQLSHSIDPSRGFRTNLELVNLTGVPITVEVDLYSAGGTHLGTRAWELRASEDIQVGKVFEYVFNLDVDDGFALVRTPTPGGAFLASASVVDNLTGDGFNVPVIRR